MRHQHHDAAVFVQDAADVRDRAVAASFRGVAARPAPRTDRWDLFDVMNLVEHVKQRVVERDVDDRIALGRQRLGDFARPDAERILAPEIVRPQEAALEHVVVKLPGFGLVEVRAAWFGHHHADSGRAAVGQPDDDMNCARLAGGGSPWWLSAPDDGTSG